MRFDSAIDEDVAYDDTFLVQRLGDQPGAVAVGRVAFGAHQADTVVGHAALESNQGIGKCARCANQREIGLTVAVAGRVTRARAEAVAEKDIADAGLLKTCLQRPLVELREAPAGRMRAHVGECGDAMLLQQSDENLDGVVRVTNGVEHAHAFPSARSREMTEAATL